ncbi:hypothetical protein Vi05172_g12989 [Venturia inaequalis]|nr:hypothetical protein Vi05172_g12989 [Venturia inaequalis]
MPPRRDTRSLSSEPATATDEPRRDKPSLDDIKEEVNEETL